MEQSFLRVCLCALRRFLYFGVRCCVCLTFPIEPCSSPLALPGVGEKPCGHMEYWFKLPGEVWGFWVIHLFLN